MELYRLAEQFRDECERDTRDNVAEVINVNNAGLDAILMSFDTQRQTYERVWLQVLTDVFQWHAAREVRTNRREDVAPMKGRANLSEMVCRIGEVHNAMYRLLGIDVAEQAVVRSDKIPITGMKRDGAPCAADTGINDADEDRTGGEIAIDSRENPGRRRYPLWRNLMRDIDKLSLGDNPQRDPFQHAHVAVTGAKVGHEGDKRMVGRRRCWHMFSLLSSYWLV